MKRMDKISEDSRELERDGESINLSNIVVKDKFKISGIK